MPAMEQAKETIRKLLNLAESSEFDGEIENALRFANRLMDEHHLTEDDVHEADAAEEVRKFAEETCNSQGSAMSSWEGQLAMFVCEMVGGIGVYRGYPDGVKDKSGCVVRSRNGKPLRRTPIHFYGREDEVEMATDLYNRLSHTIAAMSRLKYNGTLRGPGRSYSEGFVAGLASSLKRVRVEALCGDGCQLAIRSTRIVAQKREQAKIWLLEQKGIKLSSGGRQGGGGRDHAGAHLEGMKDGKRADGSPRAARLRLK